MFRFVDGAFARHAAARPDAPAFFQGDCVVTWGDWEEDVGRAAAGLAALGIGHRSRVAVRTGTRYEWFVIHGALSRLCATMVTINRRGSAQELDYVLTDSGAQAFIIDDEDISAMSAVWQSRSGPLVSLHDTDDASVTCCFSALLRHEALSRPLDYDAPAGMIMYTSGTTGKPKGLFRDPAVMQLKREWMDAAFEAFDYIVVRDRHSRTLLTHPMHHTAGSQTCIDTLIAGGAVVIQPKFDAEGALELISRHGITHSMMVPTMLHRIRDLRSDILGLYDCRSLLVFELGGAPVPDSLKHWASQYFGPQCRIYEAYGASEIYLIAYTAPQDRITHPQASGRIVPTLQVAIVDSSGTVCPPGQTGEICASTPMLIEAYLNNPPLSYEDGDLTRDGLFRTGDVGHIDGNGYLYVTGRLKDMIVSGGVNIYPAEVEQVLVAHPAVLEAAVVGAPHPSFGEEVVAFCELAGGYSVEADELTTWCRSQLASYKVPRRVDFIANLPRNEAGKVMKAQLRDTLWMAEVRKI